MGIFSIGEAIVVGKNGRSWVVGLGKAWKIEDSLLTSQIYEDNLYSGSAASVDRYSQASLNGRGIYYNETVEESNFTGSSVTTTTSSYQGTKSWREIVNLAEIASDASDACLKYDIEPLEEKYEKFFDLLVPKSYKYLDGTSQRIHTGFIAQEVIEALLKAKLTEKEFAGVLTLVHTDGRERLYLRKDEFVALNTQQIQKLKPRMTAAEQEILQLKNEIQQLRDEIKNLKNF